MITRAYLHVAGPPAAGKTAFIEAMLRRIDELVLVARGVRDETLDVREPGGPEQVLEQMLGSSFAEIARLHPAAVDTFRETLLDGIARTRKASRTDTSERWGIAPSHAGIERARLVVVNVRHERERERGERLVADLARLRKDDALFEDILGIRGTRTPITAVVANVNDPADPGLKKAIARVKRAIRRVALD